VVTWLLDISNHQGAFNIAQAAVEGYSAIICKATEGRTFNDGRFDPFVPQIKAAGLIPGAYHYLRSGDGAAQAQAFHRRITAHGGPAGWLIALDCEADASWDTVVAWAGEWNRLTCQHPFLLYTGAWWWGPRGWPGASLTPHLWHSHYVTGTGLGSELYAKVPDSWWTPGYGGWPAASILQFSSRGRVAGQDVDVDAFRGSLNDLRNLTRPGAAPPAPTAPGWPGRYLRYTPGKPLMRGDDVRSWQAQMQARGWRLEVDGLYGPASATACRRFQAEKHLGTDGVVGPVTWAAAWTMPVT
jgi:murein L,D-transpeptidase YcbB/YkuD